MDKCELMDVKIGSNCKVIVRLNIIEKLKQKNANLDKIIKLPTYSYCAVGYDLVID